MSNAQFFPVNISLHFVVGDFYKSLYDPHLPPLQKISPKFSLKAGEGALSLP